MKETYHQSNLKLLTTRFSLMKRILSRFSGFRLALFSSITCPAALKSLSVLVEVGGGVRNFLAT